LTFQLAMRFTAVTLPERFARIERLILRA
jgi:hypothetical protein